PADRNLQQSQAALLCKRLQRFEAIVGLVGEDCLPLGQALALRALLAAPVFPGQQTTRQREVGENTEVQAFARRQPLLLRLPAQQRVLVLRAHGPRKAVLAADRVDLLDLLRAQIRVTDV